MRAVKYFQKKRDKMHFSLVNCCCEGGKKQHIGRGKKIELFDSKDCAWVKG